MCVTYLLRHYNEGLSTMLAFTAGKGLISSFYGDQGDLVAQYDRPLFSIVIMTPHTRARKHMVGRCKLDPGLRAPAFKILY